MKGGGLVSKRAEDSGASHCCQNPPLPSQTTACPPHENPLLFPSLPMICPHLWLTGCSGTSKNTATHLWQQLRRVQWLPGFHGTIKALALPKHKFWQCKAPLGLDHQSHFQEFLPSTTFFSVAIYSHWLSSQLFSIYKEWLIWDQKNEVLQLNYGAGCASTGGAQC